MSKKTQILTLILGAICFFSGFAKGAPSFNDNNQFSINDSVELRELRDYKNSLISQIQSATQNIDEIQSTWNQNLKQMLDPKSQEGPWSNGSHPWLQYNDQFSGMAQNYSGHLTSMADHIYFIRNKAQRQAMEALYPQHQAMGSGYLPGIF